MLTLGITIAHERQLLILFRESLVRARVGGQGEGQKQHGYMYILPDAGLLFILNCNDDGMCGDMCCTCEMNVFYRNKYYVKEFSLE